MPNGSLCRGDRGDNEEMAFSGFPLTDMSVPRRVYRFCDADRDMDSSEELLPSTSKRASAVLPVGVKVEREDVLETGAADIGSVSNEEGLLDEGAACICSARRAGALCIGGLVRHDCKLRASCRVCCRIARELGLILFKVN